jgi:chemotaxis protein methyltransferase CheR
MALQVMDAAMDAALPPHSARPVEALEIELLLAGIAEQYGYDFRRYARASLTRRLRRVVQREGLSSVSALQEKVLHDPVGMSRLIEAISVHTTSMFRDPDVYRLIRREIIPMLRTYPFVRIWHAGCSTGEEVYSLAILLHEEGLYDRCRIYATDISDTVLDRASKGIFPLRSMRENTIQYQACGGHQDFSSYYTADSENVVFRQRLRKNMIFSQHNLVCDRPFNEFQLILCRNVLIYFDHALRARVHDLFLHSLNKFGLLVLGKRETHKFTGVEASYQELVPGLRIYRRIK